MAHASRVLGRHMAEVRGLLAEPLAARLGRPAGEIRDEGLSAGDFRTDETVELTLYDGSTMVLRYAFFVVDVERGLLGVFSEHCGYYCFALVEGLEARHLRAGTVCARYP